MPPRSFLVVDDEPDVLALVEIILGTAGQRVRTVSDLDDAVTALRDDPPDVLLLDVSMPSMDGPTFVGRIRELGLEPPEVHLLSAIPPDQLEELASSIGVQALPKPFTTAQLRGALIPAG
jgi:CheY-like chemotaxis protein